MGNGATNVFAALNNLVADYSSGTIDLAQAATDTQALTTALNYVSQQRVTIDSSITQLASASNAVTNEKTQLMASQTSLMQADVAKLSTQLSLSETQQTALEAVIVQLGSASNSLFSKL
jgi:flagellar hook-associated protein 3 FlgL